MLKYYIIGVVVFSSMFGFSQVKTVQTDTLVLYYESNAYKVTNNNENKIIQKLLNKTIKNIEIHGFADYVGSNDYNNSLALKRAKTVLNTIKKYNNKAPLTVLSMGETYSKQDLKNDYRGVLEDRKVICYIHYVTKPDIDTPKIELEIPQENYLEVLNSIKIGGSIILKNILFYLGKAIIIPSCLPELNLLQETLKNNPNLHIEIRGHVCCGSYDEIENEYKEEDMEAEVSNTYHYDYNKTLSLNRAETIKRHLVYKGIDSERITTKGMGFSSPLHFPESNEDDRLLNRRIELIVVKH